jgi:hypothetical protein
MGDRCRARACPARNPAAAGHRSFRGERALENLSHRAVGTKPHRAASRREGSSPRECPRSRATSRAPRYEVARRSACRSSQSAGSRCNNIALRWELPLQLPLLPFARLGRAPRDSSARSVRAHSTCLRTGWSFHRGRTPERCPRASSPCLRLRSRRCPRGSEQESGLPRNRQTCSTRTRSKWRSGAGS